MSLECITLYTVTEDGTDYTVNNTEVRFLFNRPAPQTIMVNFLVDFIAQEINETLSLTLQLDPTSTIPKSSSTEVYFQNVIQLTIIDNDSKFVITILCRIAHVYNITINIPNEQVLQ